MNLMDILCRRLLCCALRDNQLGSSEDDEMLRTRPYSPVVAYARQDEGVLDLGRKEILQANCAAPRKGALEHASRTIFAVLLPQAVKCSREMHQQRLFATRHTRLSGTERDALGLG